MSGTHFYLTLPSNASSDIFPDNKTTSHRVKLPQAINLSGEWEVGLYSINYPRTWYTLSNFDTHIYTSDQSGLFSTTIIDYGFYETMHDLVKSVNKTLAKDVSDNIKLTFNVRTEKVTVHLKNKHQLVVTNRMSIVLGFGGKETKIVKTTTSPYAADLHGSWRSMYIAILCNLKLLEIPVPNYSEAFPSKESWVTSLLKRSQTYNTFQSKPNPLKTWKLF